MLVFNIYTVNTFQSQVGSALKVKIAIAAWLHLSSACNMFE